MCHGMWVGDVVVVGIRWGCEGKRKRKRKKHAFRQGIHVYGIRLLFQGHSPRNVTVLLFLLGSRMRLSWGFVVREREMGIRWDTRAAHCK